MAKTNKVHYYVRRRYNDHFCVYDHFEKIVANLDRNNCRHVFMFNDLQGNKKRGFKSVKKTLQTHLDANGIYLLEETTYKPLTI